FRSNAFRQTRTTPCQLGFANCFRSSTEENTTRPMSGFGPRPLVENPDRIVELEVRALHGGPFAHHWLEVESSWGRVTLGFGPTTVPFIDAGQVSLQDTYGNIERISGMHPIIFLGLPPLNYRYAKAPGSGRQRSKPIPMTVAQ